MRFLVFCLSSILMVPFLCSADISFYGEASQDVFAHHMLYTEAHKGEQGYYVEIGAGPPIRCNNSYVFEKFFGWVGVSIDIDTNLQKSWDDSRENPLCIADATKIVYTDLLADFPQKIDYLSLDVDGMYDVVLEKVLESHHIFKVITIEHDSYRFGNGYKEAERALLKNAGYCLVCEDVHIGSLPFEDWWIHPDCFEPEVVEKISKLPLNGKNHKEIMRILHG